MYVYPFKVWQNFTKLCTSAILSDTTTRVLISYNQQKEHEGEKTSKDQNDNTDT